jgi:hypothetical protein
MEPGRYDLAVVRGGTFTDLWTFYDDDAATSPTNLTGYHAKVQVRDSPTETGTLLDTWSDTNGKLALGGLAGTITPTVTAVDTATWAAGHYFYDLQVTDPSGRPFYWLSGCVKVLERVTV